MDVEWCFAFERGSSRGRVAVLQLGLADHVAVFHLHAMYPHASESPQLPQALVDLLADGKISKVGTANARAEKYYKQFDFFFNRK